MTVQILNDGCGDKELIWSTVGMIRKSVHQLWLEMCFRLTFPDAVRIIKFLSRLKRVKWLSCCPYALSKFEGYRKVDNTESAVWSFKQFFNSFFKNTSQTCRLCLTRGFYESVKTWEKKFEHDLVFQRSGRWKGFQLCQFMPKHDLYIVSSLISVYSF